MDCGKVKFTKGNAHKALKGAKHSNKFKSGNVYYCTDCDAWHISSGGIKRGKGTGKGVLNRKFIIDSQEYNVTSLRDKNNARRAGNQNFKIKKSH